MNDKPISVLIVDDEKDFLELAKYYLGKQSDFTIDSVDSPQDALARLQNKTYDAILSDYLMPELDGLSLLQMLRSQGNTTPFILLTVHKQQSIAVNALNLGTAYYLSKLERPVRLFTKVNNVIREVVEKTRRDQLFEDNFRLTEGELDQRLKDLFSVVQERNSLLLLHEATIASRSLHVAVQGIIEALYLVFPENIQIRIVIKDHKYTAKDFREMRWQTAIPLDFNQFASEFIGRIEIFHDSRNLEPIGANKILEVAKKELENYLLRKWGVETH